MAENDRVGFYEIAPSGFNPLNATPDELYRYGIPQRPDADTEPGLFAFWNDLVSPGFSAVRPTFSSPPSSGGPLDSMLNWSGALIPTPWPKRIFLAAAEWKAPKVSLPSAAALSTPSGEHKALIWVGLDGRNGMSPRISLPQIGTGHQIGTDAKSGVSHFAWWDWWRNRPDDPPERRTLPDGSQNGKITQIDNLPVEADDVILAGLEVQVSEDVLFFIKNQTKGQFRSFLAKRQPLGDIEPLGSSAEWIVERPTDPASRKFHALPNYGSVNFRHCVARAADAPLAPGRLMTPADTTVMIEMRENFADPDRTVIVSRAKRRQDPDGATGVTCTFNEP